MNNATAPAYQALETGTCNVRGTHCENCGRPDTEFGVFDGYTSCCNELVGYPGSCRGHHADDTVVASADTIEGLEEALQALHRTRRLDIDGIWISTPTDDYAGELTRRQGRLVIDLY